MANIYRFERRAIYWEEEVVRADTVEEAWQKIDNGDADELHIQDFEDYYDEEYNLVQEELEEDPLVAMIKDYSEPYQYELFEKNA